MNAKKKSKKKLIAILFVLLCLVYFLSPLSNVSSVELVDIGEKNPNLDESLLDVKGNFWLLDTEKIKNSLMLSGFLDSVSIEKEFYCKLSLKLEWKKPVIAVRVGERYAVLDKSAYVLYFEEDKTNLGSVDGIIVKSARLGEPIVTNDDRLAENAIDLHFLFLANSDKFTSAPLKPRIKIVDGQIINVIADKYEMNFGNGEGSKTKFAQALAIYNKLSERSVTTGVINVSRKNHYVYETWK